MFDPLASQILGDSDESVTNISNLSPTHLVSNIRQQQRCNPVEQIQKKIIFGNTTSVFPKIN